MAATTDTEELSTAEKHRLKTAIQNLIGAGRETFEAAELATSATLTEQQGRHEMDRQARARGIALERVSDGAWELTLEEDEEE